MWGILLWEAILQDLEVQVFQIVSDILVTAILFLIVDNKDESPQKNSSRDYR